MPEVRWVLPEHLRGTQFDSYNRERTPVLTLDQLEAWLEKQKKHPDGTGQLTINYFIDNLLAQMQAWKEGA